MADAWTMRTAIRLRKEALKRLTAVAIACTNDLKQTVSTPAPRRIARTSGRVYAATPATPGAPPRKLTGRGRAGISYQVDRDRLVAVVGVNVAYMPVHERRNHPWVVPTLRANRAKYERILTGA